MRDVLLSLEYSHQGECTTDLSNSFLNYRKEEEKKGSKEGDSGGLKKPYPL
jgi:hypothetical protein